MHEKREISLMGKVLLVNSQIMSQFWHMGSILEPNEKYIKKIYKLINNWINGARGEYIIEKLMKPKLEGGAGLLNLRERLKAIKIKARGFLITGNWGKEQDTIVYWAGTRNKTLSNRDVKGPKCEHCRNYSEKTFRLMVKHKEQLKNIETLKVKEIEEILGKTEKQEIDFGNIYKGISTKLISLNYRIATNILKTAINRNDRDRSCSFCKSRSETIYHLFLECNLLGEMRDDLLRYANSIREREESINWNYIINMKNMENKIEYEIISIYKKVIWQFACNIRFNNENLEINKMRRQYEIDLSFYLTYIYKTV